MKNERAMNDQSKLVYLMRGLPGCGKSFTARRLAGPEGVVLETDQYFHTEVGDDPCHYDYRKELLPKAREWNFARFKEAISSSVSPIIVDRGNGLNLETRVYAAHAVEHSYEVQFAEPESPWWHELRVLLKYKDHVSDELLNTWAKRLANSTRAGHRVPSATIRRWMARWKFDLTVHDILALKPPLDQA